MNYKFIIPTIVLGVAALPAAAQLNRSTVVQVGEGNLAISMQSGFANRAETTQAGEGNTASTTQTADGGLAVTMQVGEGFESGIVQTEDGRYSAVTQVGTGYGTLTTRSVSYGNLSVEITVGH